jgi:hypothetical protein
MLMAFRFYSSGDGTDGVAEMLTSRRAQRGGGLTSEGVSLSVLRCSNTPASPSFCM